MPRHPENARIRTTWLQELSEHTAPLRAAERRAPRPPHWVSPSTAAAVGWGCPTRGWTRTGRPEYRTLSGWRGRLSHHPPQAPSPPHSVHPLPPSLGGALGDPRSPWSDRLGASPRSPGQTAPENRQAPASGGSDGRHTCAPHSFKLRASYPHFAIFIRAPAPGRGGRVSGSPQLLSSRLSSSPATAREPRPTWRRRARIEPLPESSGAGLPRRRCCREFANTNGNQGSRRRGVRKGAARAHACAQAAAPRERARSGRLVPAVRERTRDLAVRGRRVACLRSGLAQAEESAALCRAPPFSGRGGAPLVSNSWAPKAGATWRAWGKCRLWSHTPTCSDSRVGLHEISVFLLLLIRLQVACGPHFAKLWCRGWWFLREKQTQILIFRTSAPTTEAKLQIVKPGAVIAVSGVGRWDLVLCSRQTPPCNHCSPALRGA